MSTSTKARRFRFHLKGDPLEVRMTAGDELWYEPETGHVYVVDCHGVRDSSIFEVEELTPGQATRVYSEPIAKPPLTR